MAVLPNFKFKLHNMFGKTIVCLAFSFLASSLLQAQSPPSAEELIRTACVKAAAEKKKVFVLFHASWCVWCHKMDTAMNDPSIRQFFEDNYIITHLVVYEMEGKKHLENPGALGLLQKYKGNDLGIPYWIIFDSKGEWLADSKLRSGNGGMETGENTGCPARPEEVAHFIKVLHKTSSLKEDQLSLIEKRFRENAVD